MPMTLIALAAATLAAPALAEVAAEVAADVAAPAGAPCARGCLTPIEAVTFASYLGDRAAVAGEFAMTVKAVGFDNGRFFLNSEADYRDRNCLTIVVPAPVMQGLAGTTELEQARQQFIGQRVVVKGIARRVRIDFTADGQPTGKFYYQVHLPVVAPRQLRRVPG